MPTVKLYTRQGEFVTEEQFLPWKTQPDIVIWGQRFFAWSEEHKQYREVFAYWIPPKTQ